MTVKFTLMIVTVLAVLALALAVPMPAASHPKMRRSVDGGRFNRTGRHLVVVKERNETGPGAADDSELLEFLKTSSSNPSVGIADNLSPKVSYYEEIGIGYAVEMNDIALLTVSATSDWVSRVTE